MTNLSPNIVDVPFDALRVCEAIARIGYEPYTAIMDIVDNSVTAKASLISISLHLRPGKTLKMRNSVAKYQIVDNGQGMNDSDVINAFTLGSRKNYPANSLSKYGMGLKSAGLSLGSRISIISKKNGTVSQKYIFDIDEIEREDRLVILQRTLTVEEQILVETMLHDVSGTIVEIDGCENVNQSSPGATITKLKDRLGVVYFSFLKNENLPLTIQTRVNSDGTEAKFEEILPRDLLFLTEAEKHTGWSPEDYDYATPYLVLNEKWDGLRDKNNNVLPPISIQAVAFPQASMAADNSPLEPEQKIKVKNYAISRENSGFFIYRNGRLIRWGDGLERPNGKPLITKDDINLRIRFEIQDVHDDVLHVDVSKQRLEIDDEIIAALERIIARAVKIAKEIRTACKEKLKPKHADGEFFSATVRTIGEDDPQQSGSGEPDPITLTRQASKNEEAQDVLARLAVQEGANSSEGGIDVFQKIRYAEKIPYGQFWKPFFDSKEGVFISVNKNHPFYEEFITRLETGTTERLIVEALIFAVGLAESNVYNNEVNIDTLALEKIFRRFHRNIGQFLEDWTWENLEEE